jgi:autophagy-related protein 18
VVEAHQAPLSCIALNNDGTLLATASEKGTIIRVFSLPDARKLYQFRRGSIPSRIYSMSFNSTSTLLCVSSGTETIHIFRLSRDSRRGSLSSSAPQDASTVTRDGSVSPSSEEIRGDLSSYGESTETSTTTSESRPMNPGFASMIRRTSQNVGKSFAATVGGYLPKAVGEIWEPTRDFAWLKIPKPQTSGMAGTVRSVVAISNNGPHVLVVTNEGNYLVYNIDLEKGGEGTLVKQYSLLDVHDKLGRSISDD